LRAVQRKKGGRTGAGRGHARRKQMFVERRGALACCNVKKKSRTAELVGKFQRDVGRVQQNEKPRSLSNGPQSEETNEPTPVAAGLHGAGWTARRILQTVIPVEEREKGTLHDRSPNQENVSTAG